MEPRRAFRHSLNLAAVLQDDAQRAGRQVCAPQRNGHALAARHPLQMDPGSTLPNLGRVGTVVGHDPVGAVRGAALPLLAHPAV